MSRDFKEILRRYGPMVVFLSICLTLPWAYQYQIQDLKETCLRCQCYGGVQIWNLTNNSNLWTVNAT